MNRKPLFALGGLAVAISVTVGSAAYAYSPASSESRQRPVHTPTLSVVATGLDNPRHLTIGPDGAVYVAEAGTGGTDSTRCPQVTGLAGDPTTACVGKTGVIAKLSHGAVKPVLTGLESVRLTDTDETLGPSGVAVGRGKLLVAMQDFSVQSDGGNLLPSGDEFGKLVTAGSLSPSYSRQLGPDLAAFAAANPQAADSLGSGPGETAYDSDPYDVVAYRGGYAVADAAANSILWVSPTGRLSRLAALPATAGGQAVPDSITVGPDGALYVGGLRGVPSAPGTADVYRVMPGEAPTVFATGFSAVSDLAFDRHGDLLVLEYSTAGLLGAPTTPGDLVKVANDRDRTRSVLVGGLVTPTGLAVARDGAIYLVNHGLGTHTDAQSGEVDVFK